MSTHRFLLPAILLAASFGLPALADEVDDPGRLLASNCFQCHGLDGQGARRGFDGIEAREVVEELREMARSDRYTGEEGIMRVHAHAYTADEVALIADYLAQACGYACGDGPGTGAPVSVSVHVARTRFGDVVSDVAALSCTEGCSDAQADLPAGGWVVLTAVPTGARVFDRWGGDCRGRDPVCVLSLDEPRSVSARFARQ
ncbi:MAG: hypothetical protein KDK12_12965 [Rhodobacteraceae bacterium]|nr:hypothetical protein [Paracoccaceae bacterium]